MRKEVIGPHVLFQGDAREVLPTLDPVDMIFTDPPYGHNNNNGDLIQNIKRALGTGDVGPGRPILNDGAEETHALITWFFSCVPDLLRHGSCCCCCCGGGGGPDPQFARWSLLMDEHLDFKQMVVWDKGPIGMGWHYRRSYETVLVGQKGGAACKWFDTSNRVENIIRPGRYGIRKLIPSKDEHPTPKPPELARHFIRLHSAFGDTILDPFMGACSTGVAAHAEGRRFIGCELDPHWFDVACRRLESTLREPKSHATRAKAWMTRHRLRQAPNRL